MIRGFFSLSFKQSSWPVHWGVKWFTRFISKVLGAQQRFSKCVLEGESSYVPSFFSTEFCHNNYVFFFLSIIKNFTGVLLSNSHLKNGVVKSYKLLTGEGTPAPGSDVAVGIVLWGATDDTGTEWSDPNLITSSPWHTFLAQTAVDHADYSSVQAWKGEFTTQRPYHCYTTCTSVQLCCDLHRFCTADLGGYSQFTVVQIWDHETTRVNFQLSIVCYTYLHCVLN